MQKQLEQITQDLNSAWQKLHLDEKLTRIAELEKEVADPSIWINPEHAKQVHEELSALDNETHDWKVLKMQVEDITELIELDEKDLEEEISTQLQSMSETLEKLKKSLKFTGKYDHFNAVLRITSGAGGVEAMDWASMLERMYLRFCEKQNFKTTLLDRVTGEEAGIKTAVYEIKGTNTYGMLKSEHGVHRLVRLSPFNADNLRQTSFALVEVLPLIEANNDIEIDEKDLRIDTYHSSGHGGQGVNTTNSAVRITHIPTNTVVAIQNERSQQQNREKAMEILKGKLVSLQLEQQAESINKLRAGESASWGQQIRNYVMQPYKLVKDTRTKFEDTNVDKILDGNLLPFIESYLENLH